MASELCGKADKTKVSYTVSESSSNANVGWLSGRTSSSKGSVSASKQYQKHKEPLFDENVFFELKNAQAIVVAFDGISPLPPTYCYLKLDFLPITMTLVRPGADRVRSGKDTRVSFEVIIPFLKPIKHLLESETVSEIMVNPDSSVWIEEDGQIQLLPGIRFDDGALQTGLEVIANRFGKKLDADSPIMNLRLPDGSRMAAMIPPVVNPRPLVTIRRFTSRNFALADLIQREMLTDAQAVTLSQAVRDGRNILIAGGTGSGKTTLLMCWQIRSLMTTVSSLLRIRQSCISASRTLSLPSPRRIRIAARSRSTTCSKQSSAIGRTASSWAKCAGRKHGRSWTP